MAVDNRRRARRTTIRTRRLTLRRARATDLHEANAFMSDAEAMQYWATPPHADLGQTRGWLSRAMAAPRETDEDYMIEMGGRVIGHVGASPLPEFGFILHPDYWGRGIAREASSAVIAHIFATHRIGALSADVDPRNTASIGLLERLGFRETGRAERTLFVAGRWVDSIYFRLPRPAA